MKIDIVFITPSCGGGSLIINLQKVSKYVRYGTSRYLFLSQRLVGLMQIRQHRMKVVLKLDAATRHNVVVQQQWVVVK